MASRCDRVALQCISGKSVELPFPVTFKAVLAAAVAPPFSFTPESVKVHTRGGLINVQRYVQQHPTEKDGGVLDESAFTVAATSTTKSAGLKGGESLALLPTSHAAPSAAGRGHNGLRRSLIIYGVPRRVRALLNGTPLEGTPSPLSSAAAPASSSAPFTPKTAVPKRELVSDISASHTSDPRTAAAAVVVPARPVKGHPSAKRNVMRSPLPYPHSPDGLLELAKAVSEPGPAADEDEDDIISYLQGAPPRVYNHPTMIYLSNEVKGNLTMLRAAMEQIYRVAPVFYAWIEANPQDFLSALNRVGERSLQHVREQLRLLAMQAVAGQMSGDGPSRRVMMLEVNTRDGAQDLYQLEVQVGDFSDDDDEEEDDSASTSESLYYTSAEPSEELDYDDEVDAEEVEEEDRRRAVDASNTDSGMEVDESGKEETRDEETAGALQYPRAVVVGADGGRTTNGVVAEAEAEGDSAPHRGAILLPPVDSAAGAADTATATESPTQSASTATPAPPPGHSPARTWRHSPPPPSAAAVVAESGPTAAGGASTAAENMAAAPQDDDRLVQLREEACVVEALRHEYVRQSDDLAAQKTHKAIMALRRKMFAVVGELCNDISSSAFSYSSGSAATAEQHVNLLRRVVRCACEFFVTAEEFYAQLEEEGVRASVFGPSPQESLAAWAAVAALSRLLMCDVDAAGQAAVASAAAAAVAGPRRVGALRSLHTANAFWSTPALHWALTCGPEVLLASMLQLCRQQRAVMVWYSSHYLVKAVGKTIQTMAYVFGGAEEAQQPVALQRLKMTSKAHKLDEVADCLRELSLGSAFLSSSGSGGDPSGSAAQDSARRQWFWLMRTRYQMLVRPIEGDLPAPHMTSNTLYVCDTRQVLPPRETMDDRGRCSLDSAARWWAAYCDDHNTMCADKWCVAATLRPWNAAVASENAPNLSPVEKTAVCLVSQTGNSKSSEESVSVLRGLFPTEIVVTGDASSSSTSTSSASSATARHAAVLHEVADASSSAASTEAQTCNLKTSSPHGLSPHFMGDIHVVDVATSSVADPSPPVILRLAGGAELQTYLTTVARNYLLPTAAHRSVFLRQFFGLFARHQQIPAAAAARQAALANASANDAPWLVCEYVLLDYGGAIHSIASPAPAAAAVSARPVANDSTAEEGVTRDDFVQMPVVPLSHRLSEPRPISVVSRGRTTSVADGEGRAVLRTTTVTTAAEEDAAKRRYARTHAIDELYEMMLGSLLEHQPTGEENVLDHLVNYLEASEDTMQEKVRRRQAETAGAAAVVEATAAAAAAPTGAFPSPQPPSTTRNTKGRPSLQRRKYSS
ncbi:hypothetical protein ABB37_04988 [Leptomonas pyrrhocoris]|uniref:Uncharacterized protein n=1 Tax=Leptomonas pyrrhocoris TaxID=157538 RepID=A0A0M9G0Y0_LEPPY|nr:hypothetical protein ABB37_04988 [Leptomonas pyrrhocoris]KPA79936.1 hypothetical protein ABB37_04988 [Leptomonas pyrrhocoris]|eukprot:XP_015658375.1 hypothetical protein ABB37_04988 [Leptomonas pyrrhocoris]